MSTSLAMSDSLSNTTSTISCSTCTRLGRECYNCYMLRERHESESSNTLPSSLIPDSNLSVRQLLFIENYLATHEISKAAKQSRISIHTAYNYLADPVVLAEIRARAYISLGSSRKKVADALLSGATNPKSKSQAAMQRIFWTLLGDLTERKEISGPGGGPIEVDNRHIHTFDSLPIEEKRKIIDILERNGQEVQVVNVKGKIVDSIPRRTVPMPIPPEYLNE